MGDGDVHSLNFAFTGPEITDMNYLVLGGTGTVGSEVVDRLLKETDSSIRVLTRSQDKIDALPDEVTGIVGDMEDPSTYDQVFSDTDRLFLVNPVSMTELHQGLAAINEAQRTGVEYVVYLSVHSVAQGAHIPHFASKLVAERALRESGLTYTILRPNNFYQNDHILAEVILEHGAYAQPIGDVGLSRVDVGDIADAAVNAFTESGHENEIYPLVGPDVLTGSDCAAVYSDILDQDIQYGGSDLDAWEEQMLEMLPHWMVYDFRLMYRMFQEEGLAASEDDLSATRKILGRSPRNFKDFVEEAVASWR